MPDFDAAALADEDTWPTPDLKVLEETVAAELGRRWRAATAAERAQDVQEKAQAELDRIATSYHTAVHGSIGTRDNPVPYEAPTGPHNVWPAGAFVVTDDGRVWHNPHQANSWPPGAVGSPWVDVTPAPASGKAIRWAPGQTVAVGDERECEGRVWGAKVAHTTHEGWKPSVHTHAVWEDRRAAGDEQRGD